GFNRRLRDGSRMIGSQGPFFYSVYLSDRILQYPDVPLLLDVDGEIAEARNILAYYSAPPAARRIQTDVYDSGQYWFPALRHRGRVNVAFVGGHGLSSADPLDEPWWRWDYTPGQAP